MAKRPKMSFWQIWNMSFGFLGIQMGFALQNGNASRILTDFGADLEHLPLFWLVAPLTGLIVQPIIGHYSDHTWSKKFGRRKPFFFAGAVLAAIGLILLPRADFFVSFFPALVFGAAFLMLMDASFNVAMEPFRALVADKLPNEQRTSGFSIQTVIIGIGAVVGSFLPIILNKWFDVANTSLDGGVSPNVKISFFIGAVVLVGTILITIFTTKEFSPEEMESFDDTKEEKVPSTPNKGLLEIFIDFKNMPSTMKQLGWVQFFSWFGLFGMWVFTTSAVAHHIYGLPLTDTKSADYNNAADWVGLIFGVYNFVAAIFAFTLPRIAKKIGRKRTHSLSLIIGAVGLISMYVVPNENWLILSMTLIGVAWASILAMPYAILAGSIPAKKMGVYMGIFNFFIVIPQIINGLTSGYMVKYLYGGNPIFALITSGISFLIAAYMMKNVKDEEEIVPV